MSLRTRPAHAADAAAIARSVHRRHDGTWRDVVVVERLLEEAVGDD